MKFLQTKNYKLKTPRGFSLIELMVTLAIFTVVSGVVLANYPDFNAKISRDTLVQNIALSIREAQVYGTSIRTPDPLTIATSYGLNFGDDRAYYLFRDSKIQNSVMDTGAAGNCGSTDPESPSECITSYSIAQSRNKIQGICGNYYYTDTSNSQKVRNEQDCIRDLSSPPSSSNPIRQLHILFTRPNPEASIIGIPKKTYCADPSDTILSSVDTDGDGIPDACRYSNVALLIGDSVNGPFKKIIIWSTGQVAVE